VQQLLKSLGDVTAVIGAQWGDEGKGKLIDLLTPHFDILARASGGANAGHTIVVQGKKHVFHLLPAGSLHEGKTIVLGSGMVIHLPTLLEEIETLKKAGIDVLPRLKISRAAHIVTEEHKERDAALEKAREGGGIGTTKRGIGPAYTDKAARHGKRMESLLGKEVPKEWKEAAELLVPCITDTVSLLHDALAEKKSILIEGAQATLLDIDHGTYPYVTSSSTTAAGALQGLGLSPRALHSCIGVAKAYCTRVGGGPFETEANEVDGNRLRERGGEYGATTGRPRRCGWLSIPDLLFACRINGFTHVNLTKLDVLDEEKEIPVLFQGGMKKLPGWKQSTAGITSFEKLPKEAQSYVKIIEGEINVPVSFIGTGPGREEMIVR